MDGKLQTTQNNSRSPNEAKIKVLHHLKWTYCIKHT